jgi:hypothetical protein
VSEAFARVEQLGRRSRTAAVISLVGFLLVLAAIGFSIWQISELEARKKTLDAETKALEARVAVLNKDIAAKRETLDKISRQVASGDVAAVEKTLVQQAAAPSTPRATPSAPAGAKENAIVVAAAPVRYERRVYFQIRTREQTGRYRACARMLAADGWKVPPVEYVPDRGPATNQVRYFRAEEADQAQALALSLGKCVGGRVAVILVGGYRDSPLVKPQQFEVWFAPGQR